VIGPLNKKQLEVVRLIVWERLLRNPEYRVDYFDLLEAPFRLDLDSYMEKYNAFVEKWKLPTPLHPDWNWEEIAQYKENWKWFIGHTLGLFDYPVISKPLVKEILRNLFEEHPSLQDRVSSDPNAIYSKPLRFSAKWEIAYRVYDLCEIEGKTEEEAATIIKAETRGKVDLTDDAIHKAKKRVYELIFDEPYTTKRERRKRQFGGIPPCAKCTGRECEKTKEICEEMERWFQNTLTRPDKETPARYDRLSKHGNNKHDEIRAQREMAAYLAYPTCVFVNPKTGDSFGYHSPKAVKVFFHVPRLRLNSVSISKRLGFFYDPEC